MPPSLKVDLFTYSFSCFPQYVALSMHMGSFETNLVSCVKTLLFLTWDQIMLTGRLVWGSDGCSNLLLIREFCMDFI